MNTQAVNGSLNTALRNGVAPDTAPLAKQDSSAINAPHSLAPEQTSAALRRVATQAQCRQSETDLTVALPAGRETLTRRELAYKIAEKVFAHNGVFVSLAALEEVAAELQQTDRLDINGSKRGNWVDAQLISQANGQAVKGYWFRLMPEFQQHILGGYKNKALQVTQSGTQPVTSANMQGRMGRAISLAYERHMTSELRIALGENATPERIAALVGVAGGTVGILAKTSLRGALGIAGAGLAAHQGIQTHIKWDNFLKACAEAKSPSELDIAAREFGKLITQLGVDGLAALLSGAAAKAAPRIAGKVDALMQTGARAVGSATSLAGGTAAEAVTAEGIRVRVPVDYEVLRARPFQMAVGKIPDVDYKGRPYTPEQKKRIQELGDDPGRGFRLEEGEAGLATEEFHGLKLKRYEKEGFEFVDQHGNHWDVVSPPSMGNDGKPAFNVNLAIKTIKKHCLKGNVILDYGQLNKTNAETLRKAIAALTEADKRGRAIITVRHGG